MEDGLKNEDHINNEDYNNNVENFQNGDIEGCIVYYLKKMFTTPHLDSHSTTDPKPEILSAV